jgi:hypothetical protein
MARKSCCARARARVQWTPPTSEPAHVEARVLLFRIRIAVTLHSLCIHFTFALSSLWKGIVIPMRSLCNHFALATKSLRNRLAITSPHHHTSHHITHRHHHTQMHRGPHSRVHPGGGPEPLGVHRVVGYVGHRRARRGKCKEVLRRSAAEVALMNVALCRVTVSLTRLFASCYPSCSTK